MMKFNNDNDSPKYAYARNESKYIMHQSSAGVANLGEARAGARLPRAN